MTNTFAILFYAPLLMISLLLFFATLVKRDKQRVDRWYLFTAALMLGWQAMEILYYALADPWWVIYVYSAKFVFIAFVPVAFLYMVVGFYRLDRRVPKHLFAAACIIPAITALVAATSPLHAIFRQHVVVAATAPVNMIISDPGPWYVVNLIYSQLPLAVILGIVLTQHRKMPKIYRGQADLILTGLLVYIAGIVVEMSPFGRADPLDYNLAGASIAGFLFYMAVAGQSRADYMGVWQRNIFNYLDEAMFVLDKNGVVTDANDTAVGLLQRMGLPMQNIPFGQLLTQMLATGRVAERAMEDEAGRTAGVDIYFLGGKYPIIFNMQRRPIPDHDHLGAGEFVTLAEVTRNRLLIERLRETAGVDPLTGLANRFRYQQLLRQLDMPENLPLSIVMGDVNGLKMVNDRRGHAAGDQYLRRVAAVLTACCPDDGHVVRMGGDEFAMLLPRCSAGGAAQVMQCVQDAAEREEGDGYALSIALGSATKTRTDENINALLASADASMYSNKA